MPDPIQDLRDERALRLQAEEHLTAERERTALWRRRAEERSERIARLEAELDRSRGLIPRLVSMFKPPRASRVGSADAPSSPRGEIHPIPRLPVVKVVAAVGAGNRPIAEQGTPLDVSAANLATADLVLIDAEGWAALTDAGRAAVAESAGGGAGTPLVYLQTPETEVPSVLPTATVVGDRPTFTPEWGRPDRHLEPITFEGPSVPSDRPTVGAAARGRPIRSLSAGAIDPEQASVAARRWAVRNHAPWLILEDLLGRAGVRIPSTAPTVAAILVSNRPAALRSAIGRMARQTRVPDQVVIGLHGIAVDGLAAIVDELECEVEVMSFTTDLTLGEVLNRAVAASSASLVAKIDDDDHYGPAYVEDSVSDLIMSGAGVVGKAAMFLHVADGDTTYLRRADQEEKLIGGTMPGGSLVMHRRVWESVAFPHRPRFVDAFLLDGARRVGEPIVSGHRFEFCLMRHGTGHTFEASSDRYLSGAVEVGSGFDASVVDVADLP